MANAIAVPPSYHHSPGNYICPFCILIQGIENEHIHSVRSDIVYQDRSVTAFISSHQWPRNHGNTIIVPNEHFENVFDLPDHYAAEIHCVTRMIAQAMKVAYSCGGISTRQHNEPAGCQDVWHYHVHVTPRYIDDRLYTSYQDKMLMSATERAKHAEKLKDYLTRMDVLHRP